MQFQKKATTTLHVKECKRAITWRGAQYSELNSCTTLPSSVFVGWFRFWLPVFYLQSFHFYFVIVFLFLSKFVFFCFFLFLSKFSCRFIQTMLFFLNCIVCFETIGVGMEIIFLFFLNTWRWNSKTIWWRLFMIFIRCMHDSLKESEFWW